MQRTQRHSPAKEQAKDKRDKKETRERQTRENKREEKLEGNQEQREKDNGREKVKERKKLRPKEHSQKLRRPKNARVTQRASRAKDAATRGSPPSKNGNPKSGTSPRGREPRTTEPPNPVSKVSHRAKDITGEKPSPTLKSPTAVSYTHLTLPTN